MKAVIALPGVVLGKPTYDKNLSDNGGVTTQHNPSRLLEVSSKTTNVSPKRLGSAHANLSSRGPMQNPIFIAGSTSQTS